MMMAIFGCAIFEMIQSQCARKEGGGRPSGSGTAIKGSDFPPGRPGAAAYDRTTFVFTSTGLLVTVYLYLIYDRSMGHSIEFYLTNR